MYRLAVLSLFQVLFLGCVWGQGDTIKLINPSFEGNPLEGGLVNSDLPRGWIDCGFRGETAPDIHPVYGGQFSVSKSPSEGRTYIGMVVRDNDTWERIAQKLVRPMQKGKCYEFSIYVSKSELYLSKSRVTDKPTNYVKPTKLRIFGGTDYCHQAELLGETNLIRHTRWLEYRFTFEPTGDYSSITLEAFYNTPTLFPYNGNILIDNASHLVVVPCDGEEPPIASVDATPKKQPNTKKETPNQVEVVPPVTRPSSKKSMITEALDDRVREDQIIRIEKLYFMADSIAVTTDSYGALDEVYDFMQKNQNIKIEIRGHTNTIPPHSYCDKLSNLRAKAIADYLYSRGIASSRLKYKGYGKREPLTKDTSQEGRKINQRVEIKILSLNG